MSIKIYTIAILTLTGTVSGCTGRMVHMENDQGNKVTCEVSTGSAIMTGVLARDASIDKCVGDRKQAGFKVISEE